MHPLTVAIIQFKPRKGDIPGNVSRLGPLFAQLDAMDPRPDIVQFPETALSGYFVEGGVRELAMPAGQMAEVIAKQYRASVKSGRTLDIVIGFYEVWDNALYNSALCVTLGGGDPVIRHVHRKMFLPTYGLFDEERFVDRGHDVRAFDIAAGRVAMLVCEDAWHSLSGTLAALDGAQLVLVLSAAPARGLWPRGDGGTPATLDRWERLARDMAEEHGIFVTVANLVGSEGGKMFQGGSLIAGPRGDVKARGPLWDEAIVVTTLDLEDLTRTRADIPLLGDLETMLPHMLQTAERIRRREPAELAYDAGNHSAPATTAVGRDAPAAGRGEIQLVHTVHAPSGPPPLEIDAELTANWLAAFIRDEVHRRGFERGIVGLSGGVDSAVSTYLAVRALGKENVVALRLPYRTSSKESLEHAQLVIGALGVEAQTIDISGAVDAYLAGEPDADQTRRGNVMARMRMIALFDQSARHRALPLGTGNKTERLFGYFTWHADDSPPINPIGDLFKTQVWALARHLGIHADIVGKPPTADLVHGQTDEEDLGITYAKADGILNWLVYGYKPEEIVAHGFDAADVERVRARLAGTHWKRRLPTVAMVSASAIGESYLRPVDY